MKDARRFFIDGLTPAGAVWFDFERLARCSMERTQSVTDWLAERGLSLDALEEASGVDRKVLSAIIAGRYTPSPAQRERVAAALGVAKEQIVWGHTNEVTHLYGHGPQFGRTP